jgi:hypothetical protein
MTEDVSAKRVVLLTDPNKRFRAPNTRGLIWAQRSIRPISNRCKHHPVTVRGIRCKILAMGYETHFFGRLEFTRELSKSELAWIEEIINARHAEITEEMDAILHSEREARRRPGGPLIHDGPREASRHTELLGFIAPKGPPGYIDYVITEDRKGLQYADTEKSYTMIEGLNFIIANARRRIPDFGLTGQMTAETEFAPYRWFLKIGPDGWAAHEPCGGPVAEDGSNDTHSPRRRTSPMRRYFGHLRRN